MNIKKIFLPLMIVLFFSACTDKSEIKDNDTNNTANLKKQIHFPLILKTSRDENITINKNNKGFTFSNAQNKAVLLSFITSSCIPCKAQIPHLNILQEKYKDNLNIIGVLLENKNSKQIKQFIQDEKINFTLSVGANNFLLAKAMGDVQAVPFMILYDKQGQYSTHYVGAILEEMLDSDIVKVVK